MQELKTAEGFSGPGNALSFASAGRALLLDLAKQSPSMAYSAATAKDDMEALDCRKTYSLRSKVGTLP